MAESSAVDDFIGWDKHWIRHRRNKNKQSERFSFILANEINEEANPKMVCFAEDLTGFCVETTARKQVGLINCNWGFIEGNVQQSKIVAN